MTTTPDREISTRALDDLTAALDAKRMDRRARVMFLKNCGWTWQEIAADVGVSVGTCRRDLELVAVDLNNERPATMTARHRAVILDVQRAMYPIMFGTAKIPAVQAAMAVLKALEREAKLCGIDSPIRVLAAASTEEYANEASKLIERIMLLDPSVLQEMTNHARPTQRAIDAGADAVSYIEGTCEPVGDDGPEPVARPGRGVRADGAAPLDSTAADHGPHNGAGSIRSGSATHRPTAGRDGDQPSGQTGIPALPDDDADWSNIGD